MRRSVLLVLLCVVSLLATACGAPKDTGFPATASPTETGEPSDDTSTREDPTELTGPIAVEDNTFVPRYASVAAGTAVTWAQTGAAPHNIVSDDKAFNSHRECSLKDTTTCMASGDEFTFVFNESGDYPYYCVIHGVPNALDSPANMAGLIIVE